jgi:hypothetical protein
MTKRGRIGVTVLSTAFEKLGRAQAAALGFANLPLLILPHPFGSRSRDEVRALAATCAEQLMTLIASGARSEAQPSAGARR